MARPLRIEWAGGRYHVTARGNEKRNIFRDDQDREHFIRLLGQLPERFGTRLHAFALMPNHYHLMIETPEANLSRTGQWLNVSYSVWFNRRHRRSGHLFQGRFGSVLIQEDGAFQEIARYIHLNPVRVMELGLDKVRRRAGRLGLSPAPTQEIVAERLRVLRGWRWSSYPAYAGYVKPPAWLKVDVLGHLSGGVSAKEQKAALRAYTEQAVRAGLPESPWERVVGGVVLGTEAFVRRISKELKANRREQSGVRALGKRVEWKEIVRAVEALKGEKWDNFRDRHGDWGRDAALWLGRRAGRLKLRELADLVGGIDYTAAGTAVSRFNRGLYERPALREQIHKIELQLSNIEM